MQGHRLIAPAILLTLLSIDGCKNTVGPVVLLSGQVHVRLKKNGTQWETHHYVANGNTITFKADSGFNITFAAGYDPCVAKQDGKDHTYTSKVPSGGKKHEVNCPIQSQTPGEYGYQIDDNPNETPAAPFASLNVTPCYGCTLEIGNDD